jgi:hypothetical protein
VVSRESKVGRRNQGEIMSDVMFCIMNFVFWLFPWTVARWITDKVLLPLNDNIEHNKYRIGRHWASIKLSIKHKAWVKLCINCHGAKEYYNSYDIRECEFCNGKGYSRRYNFKDV